MDVIITMAGQGTRFRQAGYSAPKHALKANGRSLFTWAMCSLSGLRTERFTFVARTGQRAFIAEECAGLGIRAFRTVELPETTDGQATTALIGMREVASDTPVLIYNIDTHIRNGEGYFTVRTFEGTGMAGNVPFCRLAGEHWSFVATDEDGTVREIAEKRRISDKASIGLYYFRSRELYEYAYSATYGSDLQQAVEKYIAPMYQCVIDTCGGVHGLEIRREDFVPLGTPLEVQAFDPSFAADSAVLDGTQ